jgi:hypothetical protein
MMRFSAHAKRRLADRHLTSAEIFGIMSKPRSQYNVPNGQVIFWGLSDNGHLLRVVFDPRNSTVVTIVVEL